MSIPDKATRRGRPSRVPSVAAGNATASTGLELLKVLARMNRPMPLTDIAAAMGMSPSRTHRYLSSLQASGFVQQDEVSGHYDIGMSTVEIGLLAAKRFHGSRLTDEVMTALTRQTGLCSYLCVWGSNGPTVVRDEMEDVQTAARIRVGSNLSMLTATGLVFLAFLPEDVTQDLLARDMQAWNREAPMRATDQASVMRQCGLVRKRRFAKTIGLRNPTWTAMSCPVFDAAGHFRMALTVIGVSNMYDARLDGAVAQQLKAAAQRLSQSSGF